MFISTRILLFVAAIVRTITYPFRWYARRKKFRSTFERAKARMERAQGNIDAQNRSGVRLDGWAMAQYFKSETEAREFKDWVMDEPDDIENHVQTEIQKGTEDGLARHGDDLLDAEILEEKSDA